MKRLFSLLEQTSGTVGANKEPRLSQQGDIPGRVLECFEQRGTTHRMGFFSDKDLFQLSLVSKRYYQLVQRELEKRAMNKLITYIVCGEENAAKRMLKNAPGRLLLKGAGVALHGREIVATPLQAALAADDERMWTMIAALFRQFEVQGKFKVGQAQGIMLTQFVEQFPSGLKTDFAQEQEARLANLKPIFDALATAIATDPDGGQTTIAEFRQNLFEKKKVTSGYLFDRALLIAVHRGYTNNEAQLDTIKKRSIYWRKVIGSVQRVMPACYQQAYSTCALVWFRRQIKSTVFHQQEGEGLGFDFDYNTFHIDLINDNGRARRGRLAHRMRVPVIPSSHHEGWVLTMLRDKQEAFEAFRQELSQPACQEEVLQEYCSIM